MENERDRLREEKDLGGGRGRDALVAFAEERGRLVVCALVAGTVGMESVDLEGRIVRSDATDFLFAFSPLFAYIHSRL